MPTEAKADIPMVVLRDHGHAPKERNASMHSGTTAASDNDGDDDADPVVDPNLLTSIRITWDGPDDLENPRNWPMYKRLTAAVSTSVLVSLPIATMTMLAPGAVSIRNDLRLHNPRILQFVVSFANLAGGVGPLFVAPQSEVYGRRRMVYICTALFLAFNTGASFSQTALQLGVLRTLAAFFGCALKPIANGILADCFEKKKMGMAGSIYAAVPLILPSLSPWIGGYLVQYASWRWICHSLSIFGAIALVAALFLVPETHAPTILKKKLKRIQAETSSMDLYVAHYADDDQPRFRAIIRPFEMYSELVVWLFMAYQALIVGIYFVIMYTFTMLWRKNYGQPVNIAGLHYLANSFGFALGGLASMLNDRTYNLLTRRTGVARPENRMPVMILGAILVPVGLFWYGWTAQFGTHWLLVDSGLTIYSCGYVIGTMSFYTYIVDYYGEYAASATAAVNLGTGVVGFVLPLSGYAINDGLGYGWANTTLGLVSLALGVPVPIILWKCGDKFRRRSTWHRAGQEALTRGPQSARL